ncbi:unnamed protein product [Prorocentrum cordatum]|uniref:Uncharacterized protein n=1 Tax=Prorocentrum cordatum TaxID=2364126 RepID=A0ABN9UHK3_9DINO|nr:unnamed protein product [Polarella glacialis]
MARWCELLGNVVNIKDMVALRESRPNGLDDVLGQLVGSGHTYLVSQEQEGLCKPGKRRRFYLVLVVRRLREALSSRQRASVLRLSFSSVDTVSFNITSTVGCSTKEHHARLASITLSAPAPVASGYLPM